MGKMFHRLLVAALVLTAVGARADGRSLALDIRKWRVVQQDSGPVNYYRVVQDADGIYLHSEYKPPIATMTRGYQLEDSDRRAFHKLRWRWRALKLPKGGNECARDKGDSAAVLYVTWKRGLKWYALKYVWSAVGPKGDSCDRKTNPFRAQETVVLESGEPLNVWKSESIDLDAEYRKHFEGGNPRAEVPDLMGMGLMSDGDQTQSESSADFADFVLSEK
jgi:hypothetical protein